MFDKIKQLKKLRDLQNQLKQESVEQEQDGIVVRINGAMEIEYLKLNPDISLDQQGESLKKLINQTMKEVQGKIASVMREGGGLEGML